MIALWIILGLLFFLLLGLLLSPLSFTVNTDENLYQIRVGGLGQAAIVPAWEKEELILVRGNVWFWRWEFAPVDRLLHPKPKKEKKKSKPGKKKRSRRFSLSWSAIKKILASFRVHYFQLNFDTNDPVWNAWLYPLVYVMDRKGERLSINFNQYNALRLKVSNRLVFILWALIVSRFNHSKSLENASKIRRTPNPGNGVHPQRNQHRNHRREAVHAG
jgi:hypothetical protein